MDAAGQENTNATPMSDAQKYLRSLNLIEEIRNIAGPITLELPQIVVIGNQSSGKSSLLSSISAIQFPEGVGTCTRCPVVVRLIKEERPYYRVGDTECEYEEIAEKIKIEHRNRYSAFSADPISVEIRSPGQVNLTLVDLPGIIHQGNEEDIKMVRRMISEKIAPSSAIILLVTEANVDEELQLAMSMARKYDPMEQRTLQVLTKCDVFSEEARKQVARNLIGREMAQEHGAHAVCCRIDGRKERMNEEMAKLRETFGPQYEARLGIENLRARLPKLLGQCIRVNYKNIRQEVTRRERDANSVLSILGESEPEPSQIMNLLSDALKNEKEKLEWRLTKHMEQFEREIQGTKVHISEKNTREYFQHNSFSPGIFQGREAFDKFVHEIALRHWKPICKANSSEILKEVEKLRYVGAYRKALADRVSEKWNKQWLEIQAKLNAFTENLIEKVCKFGTMNNYLAIDREELVMGTKFVEDALNSMDRGVFGNVYRDKHSKGNFVFREHIEEGIIIQRIKNHIEKRVAEDMQRFNSSSPSDQQVKRVHAYVLANWKIEHRHVIDEWLKCIRDNVIHEYEKWAGSIQTAQDLLSCAQESESVRRKRQEALDQRQKMRECQRKILDLENLQ